MVAINTKVIYRFEVFGSSMILLSETFIYLPRRKKISRNGHFNDLSNEFKIIQLVNYICSEKNFQWKKKRIFDGTHGMAMR